MPKEPFEPIFDQAFNQNADILSSFITPNRNGVDYRIAVRLSAAGQFAIVEKEGTTEVEILQNSGDSLIAGAGYTFVWAAVKNRKYNFRHKAASGTKVTLTIRETLGEGL